MRIKKGSFWDNLNDDVETNYVPLRIDRNIKFAKASTFPVYVTFII